jgi:hypothetical protein
MSILVPIALFGWMPVVLFIFAVLPPRRAVIVAFLLAWLFLPVAGYKTSGLPDYTKMSATCVGVLLATAVFDTGRFFSLRPRWVDLPMAIWCAVPVATSLSNELGLYDGFSNAFARVVAWGLPYLIGRMYFSDLASLRELAIGVVISGLIYVPLCLFEIKMSPQLRFWVYGPECNAWWDSSITRFGGYRPVVFMQNGLAVGMWMATASIVAVWLWAGRALRSMWNVSPVVLVGALVVTTVLCKSLGSLALMAIGLVALFLGRKLRTSSIVLMVIAAPVVYMSARTIGGWSGQQMASLAELISSDRAASLQTRLTNEDLLGSRAMLRPVLGWGGWGRNFEFDAETTRYRGIPDGMWIIAFGVNGVLGLAALFAVQLLPPVLVLRRCPARAWAAPALAAPVAMAIVLSLYAIDNLFNAMTNPVYMLVAGGLSNWYLASRSPRALRPGLAGPTQWYLREEGPPSQRAPQARLP